MPVNVTTYDEDIKKVGYALAYRFGLKDGVAQELPTSFWTDVTVQLQSAGQLENGKILAYHHGGTNEDGCTYETIEIFKNAFLQAGVFEITTEFTPDSAYQFPNYVVVPLVSSSHIRMDSSVHGFWDISIISGSPYMFLSIKDRNWQLISISDTPFSIRFNYSGGGFTGNGSLGTIDGISKYAYQVAFDAGITNILDGYNNVGLYQAFDSNMEYTWKVLYHGTTVSKSDTTRSDATIPDSNPFPQTYPEWIPWDLPEELFPDIYTINYSYATKIAIPVQWKSSKYGKTYQDSFNINAS